jgi:hypothetical protein
MSPVTISLDRIRLRAISHVRCPRCRSSLEFHQPDPDLSERLLGVCEGCKVWHLVDVAGGVMVPLPDEELFRRE